MRSAIRKPLTVVVSLLILLVMANGGGARPEPPIPNPVLYMLGQEYYEVGGKSFIRYRYGVLNHDAYPNELFAPSPNLPPCGANTRSSRTWVDIFDQRGKRLYGFCALGSPKDLDSIWFAVPSEEIPPSWIYIEMNDRLTNTKYKSNLAETTM